MSEYEQHNAVPGVADATGEVPGAEGPGAVAAGETPEVHETAADEAEPREAPDPHDRSGARALFVKLRELPEGSPRRRSCATVWSGCTCRSWSTWPGVSATAASRSTT